MPLRPKGMTTPYDNLSKESTDNEKISVVLEILKEASSPMWLDYRKLFVDYGKEALFDAKVIATDFVNARKEGYNHTFRINNAGLLALEGKTYLDYLGLNKKAGAISPQIITSELKDKVLRFICDNAQLERLVSEKTNSILTDLQMSIDSFRGIMYQFKRLGFLSELDIRDNITSLVLHTEAHDFLNQGGFMVQEEIFKTNIQKLGWEIEALQKEVLPDNIERVNKIASIASNLATGLAFLKTL